MSKSFWEPKITRAPEEKKIKQLKDGATFKTAKYGVVFTLNTLIRKINKAVYTAVESNRTYIASWDKKCYPCD